MPRQKQLLSLAAIAFTLLPKLTYGQTKKQPRTLSSLFRSENFLAMTPWTVSNVELLCVFSQSRRPSDGQSGPTRKMTIYQKSGSTLAELLEVETGDWLFTAFPTREDGRLVVIWGGGSAYHIYIYSYSGGIVREVLNESSRDLPEVSFDDQGHEFILLNSPEIVNGVWRASAGTTSIFEWSGVGYSKIGTVPWLKRFECLSGKCAPPR